MWRNIVSNVFTLLIVALLGFGGFIAWAKSQYEAAGPLDAPICLRVESGSNMRRVSETLGGDGAVRNPTIFRLGADYAGKADALKAGSFLVPAEASMAEIVDIVTRGGRSTCGTEVVFRVGINGQQVQVRELDPETNRFVVINAFDPVEGATDVYDEVRAERDTRYRVSLAEGVTSWQVVEALKSADFLEGSAEEVPDEGSLAPDSYEVTAGTAKTELLEEMATRQAERLETAWQNRAQGLPVSTPEEALILASIIEKETGVPEERRTVASVFVNRLKQGMRLQTDPTVIYGVTEGKRASWAGACAKANFSAQRRGTPM